MRQQLISWLIDEIAPAIRQSKDAEGSILKFAHEQNLAPALVQGLGQLYNTAKTLAFLEKNAASNRGDTFPIVDVDALVAKYLDTGSTKSAGVSQGTIDTWEMSDRDGGCDADLPACFRGIMTPALQTETVMPSVERQFDKVAASDREATLLALEFAEQFRFEAQENMEKIASSIAQKLRENPGYGFARMEADALGLYADVPNIKKTMDKLASYCANCFPRVTVIRAEKPTEADLLGDLATDLMNKIASYGDGVYQIQATDDFKKEAMATMQQEERDAVGRRGDPATIVQGSDDWSFPKKVNPSSRSGGDASGGSFRSPRKGGPGGAAGGGGGLISGLNEGIDKLLGAGAKEVYPVVKGMFGGRNSDQEDLDSSHQDARHIAVLQQLLTQDDILSEADPDRVVEIYNTVRENAPQLAGDANVMRVLLRSAIQHDGIAPYDLKQLLETEQAKQKVDWNNRIVGDVDYGGAKAQVPPNKMM